MSVKVSPKYQVVIPEEIRNALGLKAGSRVEVLAKGKIAYLVPVPEAKSLQNELSGKLDPKNLRDRRDRISN